MGIKKNTAAADDTKTPAQSAGAKAAATKAAKKTAEAKPAAETEVEPKAVLGKKQIAEGLREHARENGMGLPPKLAELLVEGFDNVILNALANGNEVRTALGRFYAQHVDARTGRNPATGEAIEIGASIMPKFKPSPTFKKLLNGGAEEAGEEGEAE